MGEFNDYLLDYFSEEDEADMCDTTRELIEDCFYRQQKIIDELTRQRGILKAACEIYASFESGLFMYSANKQTVDIGIYAKAALKQIKQEE